MHKSFTRAAVCAALSLPAIAGAQTPSPVTGNATLTTDYRFRGLSQTFEKPAFQGGFDYSHPSGFYLGNWNSNVSSALYPNANLEMDFYGGYKRSFGEVGLDVGYIYYYYPGSQATISNPQTLATATGIDIDNQEVYLGGAWKWLSVKYFYAIDEFFGIPDTEGSWYLDGTATYDLGSGWGVVGHLGHQKVKDFSDASYSDWKLGVTKAVGTWIFAASYIDTNAEDSAYRLSDARKTMNIGDSTLVLSVSKTF